MNWLLSRDLGPVSRSSRHDVADNGVVCFTSEWPDSRTRQLRKRRSVAQSGPRQSRSDQRLIHLAGLGGFPANVDGCGASDDGAGGEAPEEEAVGAIFTGLRSGVGLSQRDLGGSWASLRVIESSLCLGLEVVVFADVYILFELPPVSRDI